MSKPTGSKGHGTATKKGLLAGVESPKPKSKKRQRSVSSEDSEQEDVRARLRFSSESSQDPGEIQITKVLTPKKVESGGIQITAELTPPQVAARNQKEILDEIKKLRKQTNSMEATMAQTMLQMLEDHKKEIAAKIDGDHDELREFLMSECDQANKRTHAVFQKRLGRIRKFCTQLKPILKRAHEGINEEADKVEDLQVKVGELIDEIKYKTYETNVKADSILFDLQKKCNELALSIREGYRKISDYFDETNPNCSEAAYTLQLIADELDDVQLNKMETGSPNPAYDMRQAAETGECREDEVYDNVAKRSKVERALKPCHDEEQ